MNNIKVCLMLLIAILSSFFKIESVRSEGVAIIKEIERGSVLIKRETWTNFQSVSVGTTLNRNDLIFIEGTDNKVIINCSDGTSRRIATGIPFRVATLCSFFSPPPNTIPHPLREGGATR